MKKMKKLASLLLAAALMTLLPLSGLTMTAHAEEPVTYCLDYVGDQWRFQVGQWSENDNGRELYYMEQAIKDGDLIVINSKESDLNLTVNVRLSNLTINHATGIVVTANGIDACYVLSDSVCAINSDVTNAYVYDNATCNFNKNINKLEVIDTDVNLRATVSCLGTVNQVRAYDKNETHFEMYSVAAGKLNIIDGSLETDEDDFSTTPQASASTTPAASTGTSSSSGNDYDEVPKTGEANMTLWLAAIALVCGMGAYQLKKAK